jgi:hypothetical protein
MENDVTPKRPVLESSGDQWSQLDIVIVLALSLGVCRIVLGIIGGIQYLGSDDAKQGSARLVTGSAIQIFTFFGDYTGIFITMLLAGLVVYRIRIAGVRAPVVASEHDEPTVIAFVWHLLRVSRFSRVLVALVITELLGAVALFAAILILPPDSVDSWKVLDGGIELVRIALWAVGLWGAVQLNAYCNGLFSIFDNAGELEMPEGTVLPADHSSEAW